jgi:sterol desaturase/sphingolipid hydroxylase (fatty acid hydroxylase superfamily)
LGIVLINTIFVRLTYPIVAVGLALAGEQNGWGLFNVIDVPVWLAILASVVALDFAIYLQHVLFHAVPALWRLHRMHHADLAIDVTTGLRFHPVEILLSMGIKMGVVAALGPPAVAVLIFEVLLNATAMFNHSNVKIPAGIDRVLRLFVVTPDMHRVHHSVDPIETDSNFGFNLPWWDRLLGTYIAQPQKGHEGMIIGFEQFRTRRDLWLDKMLIQPVRGPASGPDPRDQDAQNDQEKSVLRSTKETK